MQTVRTTITLSKDVHKNLKREAMEREISLNDVLVDKIINSSSINKAEIAKRKKAYLNIKKLTKGVDFSGLDYRELVDRGRKY